MEEKWDLTYIFKNDEEWQKNYEKGLLLVDEVKKYEGRLTESKKTFKEHLKEEEDIDIFVENLYMYAHLNRDLTYIFKNDEEWQKNYEKGLLLVDEVKKYEGRLTESKKTFKEHLKEEEDIDIFVENLYMYAHLNRDVDTSQEKYQDMFSKIQKLLAKYRQNSSYVITEYIENRDKIEEYLKDEDLKEYKHIFEKIFSKAEHTLSEKEERIIASFSEIMDAPDNIFTALNETDITFADVDGEKLNNTNFTVFLESKDREKRKKAYTNLYEGYKQYINTYANILATNVKVYNLDAKLRKYASARQAALSENFIDERVYDNLIDTINSKLPLLHKYMEYRKNILGLSKLEMYDIYVSTAKNFEISYTIEEAKEIIFEALKPLGKDYEKILHKCFDEHWIDFTVNDNKVGGAYSSGGYKTKPYILMSWKNNLDSLYTLAHEIGHSVHSYYSRHAQNYFYSSYVLFLAEIASTTNENLLTHYLLEKYKDNKEALIYILNNHLDGYRGTVFRQTQFAEFENEIYKLDAQGKPLTANRLCKLYKEINEKYYGPNVNTDDKISYEWARIPHFYYDFYVYQYATGFSCAVYFANSIINGGQEAVDKYINYLKAGCSKYPLDILKDAGLDILGGTVVNSALDEFARKLEVLKSL